MKTNFFKSILFHRWFEIDQDKMPAVRGDGMRGLAVFISDIRNCELKDILFKNCILYIITFCIYALYYLIKNTN